MINTKKTKSKSLYPLKASLVLFTISIFFIVAVEINWASWAQIPLSSDNIFSEISFWLQGVVLIAYYFFWATYRDLSQVVIETRFNHKPQIASLVSITIFLSFTLSVWTSRGTQYYEAIQHVIINANWISILGILIASYYFFGLFSATHWSAGRNKIPPDFTFNKSLIYAVSSVYGLCFIQFGEHCRPGMSNPLRIYEAYECEGETINIVHVADNADILANLIFDKYALFGAEMLILSITSITGIFISFYRHK